MQTPEMSTNGLEELISIPTLSHMLDVPVKTIRKWVWQRKIPYHKLGKLVRFDVREIRAWYRTGRVAPWTPEIITDRMLGHGS